MLLRKSNGDASIVSMIVILFAMVLFGLIALFQIDMSKVLDKKNDIVHTADGYLELMMSEGYLTVSDKESLTDELEALGLENINFSGTTEEPAAYGEKICLSISYTVDLNIHMITSLISADLEGNNLHSEYLRYTTSYN